MSDIEKILSDETTEVAQEPDQEVRQELVEEVQAQPRDEAGRFASKGEEGASPAQEEPGLDHAALLGERRRRQEAEERNRKLEEQVQQFQSPPAPPPSPFDDGYGEYVNANAAQEAIYAARLQTSEMLMMQEVPNLSEIKENLMEFVGSNPGINKQVAESGHPWRTAYQAYKNYQTMQQLGATNIDEMTAKIRAELEAEYASKAPTIPNSLADTQSARNGTAQQVPPLSLADILSG